MHQRTQNSDVGQNAVWQPADQQLAGYFPGRNYLQKSNISPSVQDKKRSAATTAALADSHSGIVLHMLHILYNALNFAVAL